MFSKNLETSQFSIIDAKELKIASPDSVGVKNYDLKKVLNLKFQRLYFFTGSCKRHSVSP